MSMLKRSVSGTSIVYTLLVASLLVASLAMAGTQTSPIVIDIESSSPAVSPVKTVKNKREYR